MGVIHFATIICRLRHMKKILLLLPVCFLFGCANPISDGVNNLRTSVRNGFQDMKIEVSPSVSQVATLEELKLQAFLDDRFNLTGFIAYGKSCKNFLTVDVRFYSADGTSLGNTTAMSKAYRAQERAKIQGSFKQIARDRKDLISRVLIDDLKCI